MYLTLKRGDSLPVATSYCLLIRMPHVLKLFLRPLQPLAQALDVFIVRLVLLLVHFQQRPQDFDAMLFSVTRSACSNSRRTGRYRAVLIGLQVFIFGVWLNVVLGVGESCLAFL